MKILVQYKRKNPDTIIGEKLIITYTFSSFNKDEIDELEQKCKESMVTGL